RRTFYIDVEIDTVAHKMELARAITHGMMHHWLDSVIPPFWWFHQWLNEAFIILSYTEILNKYLLIINLFWCYSYIIPEKLKLFSIIINHLQSDYEMYKLKIFVEGISWRMKAEDVSKIGFAEKTRLYNINNGKNKLVELMEK
ncbi:hypothetical protein DMN91_012008, partial [Ooceraea biroi]